MTDKKLILRVKKYIVFRNREIQRKLNEMRKGTAVKPRTKKEIARHMVTVKRSRGGAEQRAMFAKMGASGSLQGKGPDGKRTGPKIGSTPNDQKIDTLTKKAIAINKKITSLKKRIASPGPNDIPAQIKIELSGLQGDLRRIVNSHDLSLSESRSIQMALIKATKKEIARHMVTTKARSRKQATFGGTKRAALPPTAFLFPSLRAFPVVTRQDIADAVSSWGRAKRVRAQGFTFNDFKKRLTARAKKLGLTDALPKTFTETKKEQFAVYKDLKGNYRWIAISSNAFKDRDNEIVSTKALKTAVNRADAHYKQLTAKGMSPRQANLKARGPLRWWHVPGLDLGVCDFQMVNGRMLLESGTFNNDTIAHKMAKARDLNVSIGFRHPRTEPKNGIFNSISIFERSSTPRGRAANRFTSLTVKGAESMDILDEKKKALRLLLGEDANGILSQAETAQKSAEDQGIAYKGDTAPTINELMAVWNAYKEAEAEIEESHPMIDDYFIDEEEETAVKMAPDHMTELKAGMGRIEERLKNLAALLSGKREEEQKKELSQNARIVELEAQLLDLSGSQPRAMKGYRASMSGPAVEDDAPNGQDFEDQRQKAMNQMGPAGQLYDAAAALTASMFNQ